MFTTGDARVPPNRFTRPSEPTCTSFVAVSVAPLCTISVICCDCPATTMLRTVELLLTCTACDTPGCTLITCAIQFDAGVAGGFQLPGVAQSALAAVEAQACVLGAGSSLATNASPTPLRSP